MASPPRGEHRKRAKVVMLAPALPARVADNAGSRYAYWTAAELAKSADVLVVSIDGAATQRALAADPWPRHLLLRPRASRRESSRRRTAWRAVLPIRVPSPYVRAVLLDPRLRRSIRSADIIDLQWEEQGLLLPLIRHLNRRARIVCTLHDVLSQRCERARARSDSTLQRLRWDWARRCSSVLERLLTSRADAVVVFSDKDKALVPGGSAKVNVVAPPVGLGLEAHTRTPLPGYVLFVGLLSRWENEEGLRWFLTEVWPHVMSRIPEARFHIAGARASQALVADAAEATAELLGFVDDLDALYAKAAVVVAPLRLGAGVKFKVLEAVLAGAPVVTTSIGAEGIGDDSWFAGGSVSDTAPQFAEAVSAALARPDVAEADAARVRRLAVADFDGKAFGEQLERVYGLVGGRG